MAHCHLYYCFNRYDNNNSNLNEDCDWILIKIFFKLHFRRHLDDL